MKTVMHIINGLEVGGAEAALMRRARHEVAKGYRVTVVSLRGPGYHSDEAYRSVGDVRHLGIDNPVDLIRLPRALRLLVREVDPKLIHGWQYYGSIAACLARRHVVSRGAPCIWNIRHSLYDLRLESPRIRMAVRACRSAAALPAAIIYNSHTASKQHFAFGFNGKAMRVIPNGFEPTASAAELSERQATRRALGIEESDLAVGHIARLHPMKNHEGFIKAAVNVLERVPDAFFVMAGLNVTDDNASLRAHIPEEYSDRFRLLGVCRDVGSLMQALDGFCLSSRWGEACPNVLGEAMVAGLPCVATDVGDSRTLVGDTGFNAGGGDVPELTEALSKLLLLKPFQRMRLGGAARERIRTYYSAASCMDAYDALYDELMVSA